MADNAPTVIGPSILVSGHLEGDEDLTVLGRLYGSLNLTQTLVVEESGVLKADVSVRNAVISGVLVGNIEATESVELTPAGRMVGDIRAPRIIIVDGARFRGNVDMGDLDAPRASGPLPARTVAPIRRNALTTTTANRESATPARRPMPSRPAPTPAPAPAPKATAAPAKPAAPAAPAKKKAPVASKKKKIKKRVVARKGR